MDGCSAEDCSNSSIPKNPSKKIKMCTFSLDPYRRKRPTKNSGLCESSECGNSAVSDQAVERNTAVKSESEVLDHMRRKILKLENTVNTMQYDVTRVSAFLALTQNYDSQESCPNSANDMQETEEGTIPVELQYADLETCETRVNNLKSTVDTMHQETTNVKSGLSKFLTKTQIESLFKPPNGKVVWTDQDIIKGLKLRFSLSKQEYRNLIRSGYPAPSCSTLNRWVQKCT